MVSPKYTASRRSDAVYRTDFGNGVALCNCPGYARWSHCIHTKEALENMGDEITSTAIVPLDVAAKPSALPSVSELQVMLAIADRVPSMKGMVPDSVKTSDQAFALMLAGYELGVKPMVSLRHVFVINGRTEPSSQLMTGVVKARDTSAEFIFHERTNEACDVELCRGGKTVIRIRYTIEDAKRSGQANKPGPWKLYTADMLSWAALKRCCRIGAPDLINAVGTVEVEYAGELQDGFPRIEAPSGVDIAEADDAVSATIAEQATEPPLAPLGGEDAEQASLAPVDASPEQGRPAPPPPPNEPEPAPVPNDPGDYDKPERGQGQRHTMENVDWALMVSSLKGKGVLPSDIGHFFGLNRTATRDEIVEWLNKDVDNNTVVRLVEGARKTKRPA